MKLTLEQQKQNLVNSYMELLKVFKRFESLNKYAPIMERAYKVMEYARNSNHDLSKLNILLGNYLNVKFNMTE